MHVGYRLTDLLTGPDGTGRQRETPATSSETFTWSARRAGTPETREAHVVWLITQRSEVQILPPLPRPEALFRIGRGPFG